MENNEAILTVSGREVDDGIMIQMKGKEYFVRYPNDIWQSTPTSVRKLLVDNLTFAYTHFLGVSFDAQKIVYDTTSFPVLESFWFRNQMNDMIDCEENDEVEPLSYMRKLYNLEYSFQDSESALPRSSELANYNPKEDVAVIPFSFGKESLVTVGLCLELGIKPILVYCQEPSQPYEEEVKKKMLKEFAAEFSVQTYFVENGPASFRYNSVFPELGNTELGWGSETTIFSQIMIPFALYHNAKYVLQGSEFSNNQMVFRDGWKLFISADETSMFSVQKNNMMRIATGSMVEFKNTLEPLQESSIFYILYHRYPKLAKYQFSCHARNPLVEGSNWCHSCTKCMQNYESAIAFGFDPKNIGFTENLLTKEGFENIYFSNNTLLDSTFIDWYFLFQLLIKKGVKSKYLDMFAEKVENGEILTSSLDEKIDYFTKLQSNGNLPSKYKERMLEIFRKEIIDFKKAIEK